MFIVSFASGPWQANCYIVTAQTPSKDALPGLVIDPGMQARPVIEDFCSRKQVQIAGIVCTHGHVDHIADAASLANDLRVPVYLHPDDYFMVTEPARGIGFGSEALLTEILGSTTLERPADLRELADGQVLELAGVNLRVLHAPGHSPGSVVLVTGQDHQQVVFTGDVIFAGSIGRMDLPGGNEKTMMVSLRRLTSLIDAHADILPGHGPSTTMDVEVVSNIFLKEALA